MSASLAGVGPGGVRWRSGWPLWALVTLVLLGGCATGHLPPSPLSGQGRRSLAPSRPADSWRPVGSATLMEQEGSGGGFFRQDEDAFQVVQEASGLGEESWHPAGAVLSADRARHLWGQLAKRPVTQKSFGPRLVLGWVLREVLAGGGPVEYAELMLRTERFWRMVVVRPDGYLVTALSGRPLQRMGRVEVVDGEFKVGRLVVGAFYFSRGGVLYPVDEALRRSDSIPWAELGLERDWLNAALDGAQDALGELALALAESVRDPIRSAEGLAQLPTTVALLIASSPEYFARYGALSLQDQIREAARLSTHLLLLYGGAAGTAGTVGRIGALGAELPVLVVSAEGVLAVRTVAVAGGTVTTTLGAGAGAVSILHMASRGQGNPGGGSGRKASTQAPGRWVYKKPTTQSKRALDYEEQVTGQPSWRIYRVGEVEFDGFTGTELREAKGPGYTSFFGKDGSPKPWYRRSKGFQALMEQAENQSKAAAQLNLPVTWHVAEAEVANALRKIFENRGWNNITVRHTPPAR